MADRAGFALGFSEVTGLDPEVVLGWTYWENDDVHEQRRPFNWLNWKLDADIEHIPYVSLDPATDGGHFPGYADINHALDAGLTRLSSKRYDAIRQSAGKSQETQLAAIRASDWGTKHISARTFTDDQLKAAWVDWRRGRRWAKRFGKKNLAHRPHVFPAFGKVPVSWWVALAASYAK